MLRRIRRDREGREIIIIDNSFRDPARIGGFYVDLPPPVIRIPFDRYIVEADVAPPELIYETLEAPPIDRIERRYSLDEIRYSPTVRQLMPSIDLNTITFETGSWEIPPDQAGRLQVIAEGLNRAIARNPREVFLIEGHTDAVGNPVDNLSLSDRRAEAAAELLTQQFAVPPENLTSQGYGAQYLKEQTDGPAASTAASPSAGSRRCSTAAWRRCHLHRRASRRRGKAKHAKAGQSTGRLCLARWNFQVAKKPRPVVMGFGSRLLTLACPGRRERRMLVRAFSSCRYRA